MVSNSSGGVSSTAVIPSRKIEYKFIKLISDHLEEAWPLLMEHWKELATNKEIMIPNPNIEKYMELEDNGGIFTIGAFDDDKLIGYSSNYIQSNMHYGNMIVCQNDVLYVDSQYRGRVGLKLIQMTEDAGKSVGAHVVLWHAKQNTELDQLMKRRKYGVQDIIYMKELI